MVVIIAWGPHVLCRDWKVLMIMCEVVMMEIVDVVTMMVLQMDGFKMMLTSFF